MFISDRSSVCDGVIDCRYGIDEQCSQRNPLISCSTSEYHCQQSNRCIPKTWLCNGINDCLDAFASDELGTFERNTFIFCRIHDHMIFFYVNQIDCPKGRSCSSNEFSCQTHNQCVPSTAVCDGIEVCHHENDLFSIPKSYVYFLYFKDCIDGSDESNNTCRMSTLFSFVFAFFEQNKNSSWFLLFPFAYLIQVFRGFAPKTNSCVNQVKYVYQSRMFATP